MKKLASVLTAIALLAGSIELCAQPCAAQPPTVARPVRACRRGRDQGVSGAAIAAGIGVIVAIVAVALISSNAHSH